MKNKFNFYEVIKILDLDKDLKEIHGLEGTVLGMSQDDDGAWGYAVSVKNECWDISETNMVSTGKFSKREDFYPGDTVKVIVNEKGKGELKES